MTLLTYAPKSTQCSLNKIFFISRTDMQLDEGFWMRWSDNFGRTFDGGRVVIPVTSVPLKRIVTCICF